MQLQWHPIETLPDLSKEYIFWFPNNEENQTAEMMWLGVIGDWPFDEDKPSHWMPLPEPPK